MSHFREHYARAREIQADTLVDEILDIGDEAPARHAHGIDAAGVAHKRLRIDTRKWMASKLKPKKHGDHITADVSVPNGPIVALVAAADVIRASLRGVATPELSAQRESDVPA